MAPDAIQAQSWDRERIATPLLGTTERAEAAAAALVAQLADLHAYVAELATSVPAQPAGTTTPPTLLTVEETAHNLRIGRTVVWKLVKSGELRSVKIGACRRIPVDAITEYTSSLRAS